MTNSRLTVRITRPGQTVDFPVVERRTEYMRGFSWFDTTVPDVSEDTEREIQRMTGFDSFGELIGYAFIEGDAIDQDDVGAIEEDDIGFSFCILLDGQPTTYEAVNALLNPTV
jgi:hypothetical protein